MTRIGFKASFEQYLKHVKHSLPELTEQEQREHALMVVSAYAKKEHGYEYKGDELERL